MRESAILGILGATTLGYYVDAAISELRFDVADRRLVCAHRYPVAPAPPGATNLEAGDEEV